MRCPDCDAPVAPVSTGPGEWTILCRICEASLDAEAEDLADEEELRMEIRDLPELPPLG